VGPPAASLAVVSSTVSTGSSARLTVQCGNSSSYTLTASPAAGGTWSGAAPSAQFTVNTPALAYGAYSYVVTCKNSSGQTATAHASVGAFNANEAFTSIAPAGSQNLPTRGLDATGCTWHKHSNSGRVHVVAGSPGGGATTVEWCTKAGRIYKIYRTENPLNATYPFSTWTNHGVSSYGPCDANCSNYLIIPGMPATVLNIWVQFHLDECIGIPVFGGQICLADKYVTVGVLIRGDGSYADTSNT
jgi:hypothetical protein